MDDTYQTVDDPAITVKFTLEPNDKFPEGTQVLAWTTTPWTIPANMALAVGADIDYVLVKYQFGLSELNEDGTKNEIKNNLFIVAKNRLDVVFRNPERREVLDTFKGSNLV